MALDNLLDSVNEYQSYYCPADPKTLGNEYNGLDDWEMSQITDDRLYALVPDCMISDIISGRWSPEFLFDQATFNSYVDLQTGEFDSKELSQALQIKPFQNSLMEAQGYAEYKTSILIIERRGRLELPVGLCTANDQFGGGEGHQCFISQEKMKECQADGTLQYNLRASFRKTGKNERISQSEYDLILDADISRIKACRKKISEMQKVNPGFTGPVHPDPAECEHPFQPNQPIPGNPFQGGIPKPGLTMEAYQTKIEQKKAGKQLDPAAAKACSITKTNSSMQR